VAFAPSDGAPTWVREIDAPSIHAIGESEGARFWWAGTSGLTTWSIGSVSLAAAR
jgi:hypothetical protein